MQYVTDYWRFPNFILLLALFLGIAIRIGQKGGFISGLASFYTFFSSVFVYQLSNNRYGQVFQYYMNTAAARAFTQAITPIAFLMCLNQTSFLFSVFELASHINSMLMLFGGGITQIVSFNATFAAMTVPMIWFRPTKTQFPFTLLIFLPLAAIIKAGGSTPYFVMAAGFAGVAIAERKRLWVIASILLVWISAGYLREGGTLLDSNERFGRWKTMMTWWFGHNGSRPDLDEFVRWAIGTGSGTFEWLGPVIERKSSNAYIFMHNEYLQVLFEQGFLGFAIYSTLFIYSAIRAFQTPWLFGTICSIAVAMSTQFPLRFMITQIFIIVVLKEALWKKNQS